MSLKAKLEALIYAAEEPITPDQMAALLKEDLLALKAAPVPETQGQPSEAQNGATTPAGKRQPLPRAEKAELRELLRPFLDELMADFSREDRGVEIRQVAGGYRMSTKPEHHDVVRAFAKSLKPPIRLSLPALETLAVIAYKQPVTVPEINDIRGVDASGVIGTLLDRKLITTSGRKAVVGRPMLYKTSKDFLMRFGLKDLSELPSLEEFEKLAASELQEEPASTSDPMAANDTSVADDGDVRQMAEDQAVVPENATEPTAANATSVADDGDVKQMAEDQAVVPQNVTEPTVSSDPEHNQADEQADQIASEGSGG